MKRAFWLGLLSLALMVAPCLEAAAQAQSPETAPSPREPGVDGATDRGQATPMEPAAAGAPLQGGASQAGPGRGGDVLDVQGTNLFVRDDLAPGAVILGEGQPLAIEEAVAMAIRNGLSVEVERYGPLIADATAAAAWGSYDPTLSGDGYYDIAKSPNTFLLNPVVTNRDRVQGGSVGLNQLIPYLGATLDARFASFSSVTRSRNLKWDQQYNSTFFLNASVPLLRNLLWNQAWTNVKLTGVQSESAEQQFRQVLMDNVQATVNSYWGLVAARDRVRVAQKSLETARALLNQTRTQYEVGVVSQVEVVEAEAGVANREFELIQSANTYRNAQDVLIDAILGPELKPLTDLQIVPTADLSSYALAPIDVERAVAQAFEKRPELQVAQNVIDQGEINLRFAKNQRLPQLDLQGRYGYVGIGGHVNKSFNPANLPAGFPTPLPEAYGQTYNGWFANGGNENYRFQGLFSVPIPNTRGRQNVARSKFDLRRSQTSKLRLEQQIILEIRSATRTLYAAAQGIEAAERRRLAAEEQLRAERIRLEHGESTPFEVLQREEDLVGAESQKINALQVFRAAETALARAQGTILEAHAIEVDAVRMPVR